MLNSWSVYNRIIPKDWIDLVKGVLEPGSQLQWSTWFREEAKTIEQWSKARGMEISQDQLLGEGDYATIERHPYTMVTFCLTACISFECLGQN